MTTNRTQFSIYSDASSSYWPRVGTSRGSRAPHPQTTPPCPTKNAQKSQAGFRDILDEEGVAEMARVVWQKHFVLLAEEQDESDIGAERRIGGLYNFGSAAAVSATEGMVDSESGSGSGGVEII
ncbi:hypothetical protein BDW75DRAFT_243340 [Aspergillus navahoensis]